MESRILNTAARYCPLDTELLENSRYARLPVSWCFISSPLPQQAVINVEQPPFPNWVQLNSRLEAVHYAFVPINAITAESEVESLPWFSFWH